ncbi:MAG: anthranilate synthase component I family protein [Actinobacteria bacterium]|nr:anthranilate synthase component I family protein [Actinomycetota bacterium]MCI0542987.1 anthranilate synthase component I family protein [Actinomycetota bacterium]
MTPEEEMETIFDIPADLHTPVSAYLRLASLGPRYLLESVEGGHTGRYSFIGFGPTRRFTVERDGVYEGETLVDPDVLPGLRSALSSTSPCLPSGSPFGGGLVGVTGFDMVRRLYPLPASPHDGDGPHGVYLATASILVFDHLTRRMALLHAGEPTERAELRRDVMGLLRGPLDPVHGPAAHSEASPAMTEREFISGVETVKRHIRAGDVYQLVLSIRFSGRTDVASFAAYRALRLLNPSPYMYYIDLGDTQVVGSSPEALARLGGGRAELRPIAGTRRRGADEIEDELLERDLLADPKEAAEHVMLVDLARNDLGRTAVPGTVRVSPYRTVERYSHVMHLVSGVEGELRPDLDAFDLFAAAFPAGTVTGAPKLRAIEIIDLLEPVPRGLYSGSVGYFGHGGSMDQAITIRTVVFADGEYSYQAGAGIVADSDPRAEHDEVLSKAAALETALSVAEAGL